MAIAVSDIAALAGRFTNKIVTAQINESSKALKEGVIRKEKRPGERGVVNITGSEISSAMFVADGGALPTASSADVVQGTYNPVALFGRLSIPRIAASLANGTDGINLVKEQLEACGRTLGRQLGRGIFNSNLGTVLSTVTADSSTTFEVADPGPWRPGMAFEVYNGATPVEGHTEALKLYVTNVAPPGDGVGNTTITFVGTGTGGAADVSWVIGYTLYLRGQKSNGGFVSLADVTAADTLYGQAHTANGWSGTLDSTTTTLSIAAMMQLSTILTQKAGEEWTHCLVNRQNEQRYANLNLNNRRFVGGKMDAVGGLTLEFEGKPVFVDHNLSSSDLFLITQKDLSLHVFRDFAPQTDGSKSAGMDAGAVIVSQTNLSFDVQVEGYCNMRCTKRAGQARMSALSA